MLATPADERPCSPQAVLLRIRVGVWQPLSGCGIVAGDGNLVPAGLNRLSESDIRAVSSTDGHHPVYVGAALVSSEVPDPA